MMTKMIMMLMIMFLMRTMAMLMTMVTMKPGRDDVFDYYDDNDVSDDNVGDNTMKPGQVGTRARPSLPLHLLPGLLQRSSLTSSSP